MKKYLVIGNPIEHSLSPKLHNYWIKKYKLKDSLYEKRKVDEKDLINIYEEIKNDKLAGVNVTVPFKKSILNFVDHLETPAIKTGSVNTIYKKGGGIIGTNTDWRGFCDTIEKLFPETTKNKKPLNGKNIFILGAGGVTSSIIYALRKFGGRIIVSNRTQKKANDLKKLFSEINIIKWGKKPEKCDIVVNTTSLGLKKEEKINLDFSDYNKDELFYDLIYNPKETSFLRDARLRGNKIMNGKMMFLNQAKYAFYIWTNKLPEIDDEVIKLLD